ncbi:MAG: tetratricopeptide repeat protein, partial [Candidatus Eremiobacterota bacterium]
SIYDIGEESSGIPYIVMEYLDGETTLWDYMEKKDKPLEIEEAITLITPVCQALDYAHSQNIVHRDIKPENIMITRLNIVKVMDFGLACLEGVHNLTMAGEIFGTLTYFSPEQAQGLHADRRSDIYSAGVILYQMLTRKLPFEATSIPVLIKQHIESRPPSPSQHNPEIPKKIEKAILKALEKNPDDRFQTAGEFLDDLLGRETAGGDKGIYASQWDAFAQSKLRQEQQLQKRMSEHEILFEKQDSKWWFEQVEFDDDEEEVKSDEKLCPKCKYENAEKEEYCLACGEKLPGRKKEKKSKKPEEKKPAKKAEEKKPAKAEEKKPAVKPAEIPSYASPVVTVPKPPPPKSPPKDPLVYLKKGNELLEEGKPDMAIIEYEQALEINPKLTEAYFKLALIYTKQGKLDNAIKCYNDILKHDYGNRSALRELGVIYATLQKIDMALEKLEQAMEKGVQDFEMFSLMADLYVEKKEFTKAILTLKKAQVMEPDNIQICLDLGDLYAKQGYTGDAIGQYNRIILKNPEDCKAWNALGFLYLQLGKDGDAIRCFEKSFEYGSDDARAHCELGYLYSKIKKYNFAEKEYEESIFLDPNNVVSHYRLASLYYLLEKYDFALEEYKRVIQLDCNHAEGHGKLGLIYYKKNMI